MAQLCSPKMMPHHTGAVALSPPGKGPPTGWGEKFSKRILQKFS
jgi:hypothetical protein